MLIKTVVLTMLIFMNDGKVFTGTAIAPDMAACQERALKEKNAILGSGQAKAVGFTCSEIESDDEGGYRA